MSLAMLLRICSLTISVRRRGDMESSDTSQSTGSVLTYMDTESIVLESLLPF